MRSPLAVLAACFPVYSFLGVIGCPSPQINCVSGREGAVPPVSPRPYGLNFYIDNTKKLCSDQVADVLELQVSCQNDLVHHENKKDMTGKATLVETTVIKDLARNYEAEEEEEEEHDYSYIDENIIENIRKVFHDTSIRNEHTLPEGRSAMNCFRFFNEESPQLDSLLDGITNVNSGFSRCEKMES